MLSGVHSHSNSRPIDSLMKFAKCRSAMCISVTDRSGSSMDSIIVVLSPICKMDPLHEEYETKSLL